MHKSTGPIDEEKHPWSFIGGVKDEKQSFEKTLARKVEKETGIRVDKVEFVSEFCYHARLTDDNVNKIERAENQLLDFFSLRESKKLFLSNATKQFILKHGDLI